MIHSNERNTGNLKAHLTGDAQQSGDSSLISQLTRGTHPTFSLAFPSITALSVQARLWAACRHAKETSPLVILALIEAILFCTLCSLPKMKDAGGQPVFKAVEVLVTTKRGTT